MKHTEATIAAHLPEPADHTLLVVDQGDRAFKVLWRDAREARQWDAPESERRFDDSTSDPMGFYQHVKYAEAVYDVGVRIVAFTADDTVAP